MRVRSSLGIAAVLLLACGQHEVLPDAGRVETALDAGAPRSAFPLSDGGAEWLTFFDRATLSSQFDIDGIDTNAAGEVYGSGYVKGGTRFTDVGVDGARREQAIAATAGKDLLLFKLNAAGGVVWAEVVPSTGAEGNGYDLVVDRVEDVAYTSGSFSGVLNVGGAWQLRSECDEGGTGLTNAYGQSLLLKKDRDGHVIWAQQSHSTTTFAGGNEVALDAARDVIQSGTFGEATNCAAGAPMFSLGPFQVPNDGRADAFVAVLDKSTGSPRFAPIHVGGSGFQRAQAVEAGSAAGTTPGSLLLGVSYKGPTVLYSRTRAPVVLATTADPDDWDMVVAKYDYEGELVWHRSFGSTTVLVVQGTMVQEQVKGVGRDSQGDVLVSGTLTGPVNVDGVTYAPERLSPGSRSMGFVAKLSGTDGAVRWFRTFSGEQGINTCCEVAVDDADVTLVTPQTYGASLFLSTQPALALPEHTGKLGLVLRYDAQGQALGALSLGALQAVGTVTTSSELATLPGGGVVWTGTLEGPLLAPISFDGSGAEFVVRMRE